MDTFGDHLKQALVKMAEARIVELYSHDPGEIGPRIERAKEALGETPDGENPEAFLRTLGMASMAQLVQNYGADDTIVQKLPPPGLPSSAAIRSMTPLVMCDEAEVGTLYESVRQMESAFEDAVARKPEMIIIDPERVDTADVLAHKLREEKPKATIT